MPTPPKTLTSLEQEKLLLYLSRAAPTQGRNRKKIRNRALILLMLDAGLRAGEVTQLKISDLKYGHEFVDSLLLDKSMTKGGTERQVPLTARLKIALNLLDTDFWLFFGLQPNHFAFPGGFKTKPMTVRQVERIVGNAGLHAFGVAIHPHILRHTFATRVMKMSNMRVVQRLLGHKCLTSTQIYTHPDADDLQDAIDSLNGKETAENDRSEKNLDSI